MKKAQRMQVKAILTVVSVLLLILILFAGVFTKRPGVKQPEGHYMPEADARILLEAAGLNLPEGQGEDKRSAFVHFSELRKQYSAYEPLQKEISVLQKKYKPEHDVLKADWYALYEKLLEILNLEDTIYPVHVFVLGSGEQIHTASGQILEENRLLTEDGVLTYRSPELSRARFYAVTAYRKGEELLTVVNEDNKEKIFSNVWLVEADQESLCFYIDGYEINMNAAESAGTGFEENLREQIADLSFADGKLQDISVKRSKVCGKILGISEEEVTIEGVGTLKLSDELKIYRIYDQLAEMTTKDLRIGYDFSDFVIEGDRIEACLITRDEAMEKIRVLLQNSDYQGRYHQMVQATCDTDFTVKYGSYDDLREENFPAGAVIELTPDSPYFSGERLTIMPAAWTGKVELLSLRRSQGTPRYRGNIEVLYTEEGLILINEVLLEEYLYCVVPSEMPSSYPLEALKAQAVCARTYAYGKMLHSGLPSFGAHVDDSTSFQVYNNIRENAETSRAVRETMGELLYAGEQPAQAYYYSTSCGFGTTAEIWNTKPDALPYLKAKRISAYSEDAGAKQNPEAMEQEAEFRDFLSKTWEGDYEKEEAWYRWNYQTSLKPEILSERMQERQNSGKNQVLWKNEKGEYEEHPVEDFTSVTGIETGVRGPGGVLEELLVHTDQGIYLVKGEYNIRYVLVGEAKKVLRQDESEVACNTLLPSAFLVIEVVKDADNVVGYNMIGGGFGHGVGMSQNGARCMAQAGMKKEQILSFFYEGTTLVRAYE